MMIKIQNEMKCKLNKVGVIMSPFLSPSQNNNLTSVIDSFKIKCAKGLKKAAYDQWLLQEGTAAECNMHHLNLK